MLEDRNLKLDLFALALLAPQRADGERAEPLGDVAEPLGGLAFPGGAIGFIGYEQERRDLELKLQTQEALLALGYEIEPPPAGCL